MITKFSEALNQENIFIFVRHEKLSLRTPFYLRLITWISNVMQIPFVIAFIFTASNTLAALAGSTVVRALIIWILCCIYVC